MPQKKRRIENENLIIVEGLDEVNFFAKLLKKMEISGQVLDIGGKDVFPTMEGFASIPELDGYSDVKSIVVVRDADVGENAANRAFKSIKTILLRNNIVCPDNIGEFIESDGLKVGVYIMPDCESEGMLEDLCLKSVEEEPVLKCAEGFLECVNTSVQENEKPKNASKAKAQTFLAGKKEIVKSVGLGAQKDYWNFDHECMDKIKEFLENLR